MTKYETSKIMFNETVKIFHVYSKSKMFTGVLYNTNHCSPYQNEQITYNCCPSSSKPDNDIIYKNDSKKLINSIAS